MLDLDVTVCFVCFESVSTLCVLQDEELNTLEPVSLLRSDPGWYYVHIRNKHRW